MYKFVFNKIINVFLSIHLFLFSSLFTFASSPQTKNMDPLTLQWAQRTDVKRAVNQLQEANLELEEYVQRVYNAYAPYTIGEGKVMRDRIKNLERLITCAGNIEGIYVQFKGTTEATTPFAKNVRSTKTAIRFYYFDQEMKNLLGWESNVIKQLLFALDSLTNPTRHPEFVKVTKFDRNEAIRIIQKVEIAINAAVATIPGGTDILKFK